MPLITEALVGITIWQFIGFAAAVWSLTMSGFGIKSASNKVKDLGVLTNTKTIDAVYPIVYGTTRVGGNLVFATTTGIDNKYLHLVLSLGEGVLNGIYQDEAVDQIFLNGKLYTESDFAGNFSYEFFNGSSTQNVCATLHTAYPAWTDCRRYGAYLYCKLVYDRDKFVSIPTVTVILEGSLVKNFETENDYDSMPEIYTNDLAYCVYDLMTRPSTRGGKEIDPARIDLPSFRDASVYYTTYGWECNMAVNRDQAVEDNLALLLANGRSEVIYSDSKFKLKFRDTREESVVMQITENDIIQSEKESTIEISPAATLFNRPNAIKATFISADKNYTQDEKVFRDNDAYATEGDYREQTIELLGLSSLDKVIPMSYYYLERARWGNVVAMIVGNKGISLEPMDLIEITHRMPGWTDATKPMYRVESVRINEEGNVGLLLLQEHDDFYNDDYDIDAQDLFVTDLISPSAAVQSVINVSHSEEVYYYRGRSFTRWKIDFDPPTVENYPFWDYAEIWLKIESYLSNPSNLVGFWRFDDGSGRIAIDESGNENHGDLIGFPVSDLYEINHFSNSSDGFVASNATITESTYSILLEATANDPKLWKSGMSIVGCSHYIVSVRIKRIAGSTWDGALFYATSGHGFSGGYLKTLSQPSNFSEYQIIEYDMRDLTAGGDDWIDNTITALRFDFGADADGDFRIDWIKIGQNVWSDGYVNKCVKVGSEWQHILINVSVAAPLTLTFWFTTSSNTIQTSGTLFKLWQDATHEIAFELYNPGIPNPFIDSTGYVTKHTHSEYTFLVGQWYMGVVKLAPDRIQFDIWKDGEIVNTRFHADAGYASYNFAKLYLYGFGSDCYHDEYRLYDSILTDSEIQALNDNPGGLEGYRFMTKATSDYQLDPVEEGETYYIKIRSVSIYGVKEDFDNATTVSKTITGKTDVPADMTAITATAAGDTVSVYGDEVSDPDILGYELRLGDSWAGGIFMAFNETPNFRLVGVKPGTFTFWCKPKDNSGSYAATAVSATVIVFYPPGYSDKNTWSWDYDGIGNHDNTIYIFYTGEDTLACSHGGMDGDLLNEDCADISDWVDGDREPAVSEVSPAGQFRFDTNLGAIWWNAYAYRHRNIGSIPNQVSFEVQVYHDTLGTIANNDFSQVIFSNGTNSFAVIFASSGIYIYNEGTWVEVGTDLVKSGGSAEWQTWRFVVTMGDTCDVYLSDSTHGQEKVGADIDCSFAGGVDGKIEIALFGYTTNNMIMHIDKVIMQTGLISPIVYLTGTWTSPEYDLGSEKTVRVWGDFRTVFVSSAVSWEGIFPIASSTTWADKTDADTRWYELTTPDVAGILEAKIKWGVSSGIYPNEADFFQILAPEFTARYLQVEIQITDPQADAFLGVRKLNCKAAYWQ